jgi:hypothetical protein
MSKGLRGFESEAKFRITKCKNVKINPHLIYIFRPAKIKKVKC